MTVVVVGRIYSHLLYTGRVAAGTRHPVQEDLLFPFRRGETGGPGGPVVRCGTGAWAQAKGVTMGDRWLSEECAWEGDVAVRGEICLL